MKMVFADTFYWAALLDPRDNWHLEAKLAKANLFNTRLATTETVLIELLNYFSEFGAEMRKIVTDTVRDIMVDPTIMYISQSPDRFHDALTFFERRPDKGYSLTDYISMLLMREIGIPEALTHDDHFEQEGFVILL